MESFVFWFISNVQCPGGSKGNIKCTKTQEIRQDMKEFLNSAKNTRNFIFYYHHIIGWKKKFGKTFLRHSWSDLFFWQTPSPCFSLDQNKSECKQKGSTRNKCSIYSCTEYNGILNIKHFKKDKVCSRDDG